jgi:hypothetical protein
MTDDVAAVLTLLLEDLPEVSVQQHEGHVSFLAGKKVFAFTRPDGVAMKLPRHKIHELSGRDDISMLVMGKRVMKEWVVVTHADADLFKALAAFADRKKI